MNYNYVKPNIALITHVTVYTMFSSILVMPTLSIDGVISILRNAPSKKFPLFSLTTCPINVIY